MPYIKAEKRPQYDVIVKSLMRICEDSESSCPVSEQNTDAEIFRALNLLVNACPGGLHSDSNEWKGELNYLISKFCHELIKRLGLKYHVVNDIIGMLTFNQTLYSTFGHHVSGGWKNVFIRFIVGLSHPILQMSDEHFEMIGVLECCKLELYATVIRPYEDQKKLQNGSVSEIDDVRLHDIR